ncbi:hypothetical protein ACQKMD_19485 [Viridibacillus sp. NPDC096237]
MAEEYRTAGTMSAGKLIAGRMMAVEVPVQELATVVTGKVMMA